MSLFKNIFKKKESTLPVAQGDVDSAVSPSYVSIELSSTSGEAWDMKHNVMCKYIYQQQVANQWITERTGQNQGVVIRKKVGSYSTAPPELAQSRFGIKCQEMNLQCAMTVSSDVVELFLRAAPHATHVPLKNGLRIQVLTSLEDLEKARKNQFAAFVAAEALLVVWDDEATNLIDRARSIEADIIHLVWAGERLKTDDPNKEAPVVTVYETDEESGLPSADNERRVRLSSHVQVALMFVLLFAMIGSGLSQTAADVLLDGSYIRIAVLAYMPIQVFFALFFAQVIITSLTQLFGPVKRVRENSELYSGSRPRRITGNLPHVTIQCPVYKEGLATVIAPTVKSLKAAMSTYELQGGSASIFMNDDGMQLISPEDRQARIDFYRDHNIGWVARPKDGENGYIRHGKFKKASNMNFALNVSNKVEAKLALIERDDDWDQLKESVAYQKCLAEVLEEDPRAWADGNIRMGDFILLIDSDTRVPQDCLLDAVSEMVQSPNVAICQFTSGVMQVVHTFFENGITYFTNLVYSSIAFVVSNGDYAPFVGHNAILRWSAIQQISDFDPDEGYERFWSESHVSEDFDCSLRLQIEGYVIRYVTYFGSGFKEGVSLTVYDELARWEKYAYGCDELVFNPLKLWLFKGPFTPLFRKFMGSKMRVQGKIGVLSYIGTYYALAASWILTIFNYFAMGWFNGYLDKFYVDSWKVFLSVIVVFSGLGPVALATMRYRTGACTFWASYTESVKWLPLMTIFFGGLSLHLSQAILSHLLGIDMSWGATAKEADNSNFFKEVPKVLANFKLSMCFWFFVLAAVVVLATGSFIPYSWNIDLFVALFPICMVAASHLLLPIALNPALMTFSW